jgi:hypothetical protein
MKAILNQAAERLDERADKDRKKAFLSFMFIILFPDLGHL